MRQILMDIAPYLLSVITGAGGVWAGKRKRKAEAAHSELENVQKAIEIWRETAEALERKCDLLMDELQDVRVENRSLKLKIESLERKLNELN